MQNSSAYDKVIRIISPIFIYMGCVYIMDSIAGVYWGVKHMEEFVSESGVIDYDSMVEALTGFSNEYGLLLQCLGGLLALFFLIRMYRKDLLVRRFIFDQKTVKPVFYLLIIPAGFFMSLSGTFFLNITDWTQISDTYAQAEEILFSGPEIVQYIGIALIVPVCEELVYRGLIYMRLRQYMDVNLAIGISALIFGLVHMNLVQGMYGFIAGIMFAYILEKFGSLKADILAHISANAASMLLLFLNIEVPSRTILITGGALFAVLVFVSLKFIDSSVNCGKIYMDDVYTENLKTES